MAVNWLKGITRSPTADVKRRKEGAEKGRKEHCREARKRAEYRIKERRREIRSSV